MEMYQDGVEVLVLPDSAKCIFLDEDKRNPLDIEVCTMGYEECTGECEYYTEDM